MLLPLSLLRLLVLLLLLLPLPLPLPLLLPAAAAAAAFVADVVGLYGKDAFEGLRVCDLVVAGGIEELESEIDGRLEKRASVEKRVADSRERLRSGEVLAVEPVASTSSPFV